MIITSHIEDDTAQIARDLADKINAGDILLLHGTLGAGKSVFARSLIRTLMNDQTLEVPSPTFTLVQTYDTPAAPIWHFDLYRLKDAEEIYELGWEEAVDNAIMIVEWPERLGALKPAQYIDIRIETDDNTANTRTIHIDRNTA